MEHGGDTIAGRSVGCGNESLAIVELDGERPVLVLVIELGADDEPSLVDVRDGEHVFQSIESDGFQPNGLPNARGTRVHAVVGVQPLALLTAWLPTRTQVIANTHDKVSRFARTDKVGDVECE